MPWRGPEFEGERPTLGYYVLDWMMQNLAQPGRDEDDPEPFLPTQEQADFLKAFYEVHPVTGKRIIHRALLSRPRGWGSPRSSGRSRSPRPAPTSSPTDSTRTASRSAGRGTRSGRRSCVSPR
ncbi:hypothetical protein Q3A86_33145 [Streptomyces sp. NBUA17]|uniref:hypothetical protein n=1 Tax=Streptomyces sp. NBUA17 TaxID=3062275 RepID=UPI0037DA2F22